MRRCQIALIAVTTAVVALPQAAHAADSCVNPGGTAGCLQTIQAAVTASSDGDTITVAPGTYNEGQVIVDKGVRIVGAGVGQTIVDGQDTTNVQSGLFRVLAEGDDVLISDMTLRNPSGSANSRSGVAIKGVGVLGRTYRLRDLEIIGENIQFDQAVYADNSDANLVIEGITTSNTGGNPILIERHRGLLDVRDNDITVQSNNTAISVTSHTGDRVTALQQIRDNRITSASTGIVVSGAGPLQGGNTEGGFRDVAITGNTIQSGTSGIGLHNNASGDGSLGRIQGVRITGNRLTGATAANSDGVRLRGGVVGTTIAGNDISGYVRGINAINATAGHGQSGTTAPFNRIVGNTNGTGNTTATAIDVQNSWWGCNEGPGTTDCDTAPGGALVDADPWLVLTASASPASILTGGATSAISAGPLRNSAGATPSGNVFPDGVPVAFATSLGTITPTSPTAGGAAPATLTSGDDDGTATVTADLDDEQVSLPVAFTLPPPPETVTETKTVTVPGPTQTITNTVAASAQSLVPPAPGGLFIAVPETTEVFPSGRFVVRASVVGGGRLLSRGTARFGEAAAVTRLAGRAFSVTRTENVRVKMRLNRAARRALRRGSDVTARVTMTLTPRSGGAAVTQTVSLPLVKR